MLRGLGGAGAAVIAHRVTCEQMAAAALDPQVRADIVALLHSPNNISAVMRLMQLCACADLNVATGALACIHNVLWPHNFSSLPLATTLLCVNRVPTCTSLVSALARERSPVLLNHSTLGVGGAAKQLVDVREKPTHVIKSMLSALVAFTDDARRTVRLSPGLTHSLDAPHPHTRAAQPS